MKPLEGMSEGEVHAWLEKQKDFAQFAQTFISLSGKHIAGLTEAQLQNAFGNLQGSALLNALQSLKSAARPTNVGRTWPTVFSKWDSVQEYTCWNKPPPVSVILSTFTALFFKPLIYSAIQEEQKKVLGPLLASRHAEQR
ncbi:hypothetical protein QOT17_009583 [Balamuthia mandrillaris]